MNITRYILLAIFGLAGLFARYSLNSLARNFFERPFYTSTIFINVIGSFLMGSIYIAASQKLSEDMRLAIMAGFLGCFTTFSAFSLDTVGLFESGKYQIGLSYAIGSALGSILACYAGIVLGRKFLL